MRRVMGVILVAAVALTATQACKSSGRKEDELLRELANLDKETIYDRAGTLYEKGEYREARQLFSFVYDTFPNDPLGHKAALRVADTYAVKKDSVSRTEARLRYRDFVNRYPNDPDRDYALLMLGETFTQGKLRPNRDLSQLHEAMDAYQQLINLYPDSQYLDDARNRIAELRVTLAEHEWLVARYYSRNKRWRAVVWRLEYLKENYPDYPRMDEVDLLLADARAEIEALEAARVMITPEPTEEQSTEEAPDKNNR